MIMENVETDVWQEQYITGKGDDNLPVLNTSSAFDFATDSQAVQVFVNVPKTLDMYEARLYLMSDSASKNETILDGVPLAWEQGLYGVNSNGTNVIGGYNVESKEYRGNAYASCENYGQSMFMNFTAPNPGTNLYHLVFIGEVGYGTIDYMIKTEFNNTFLAPVSVPATAVPDNATIIAYASNLADLQNATLQYTNDSWTTANTVDMNVLNRICNATIPGQAAGTTVNYLITAEDTLENSLNATGSYPVKYLSTLNLTSIPIEPRLGDNVTLKGSMDPQAQGVPIIISVSSANETQQIQCYTFENGTFEANFKPDTAGSWFAYAVFNGSSSMIESESLPLTIRVGEPLSTQYAFYILGGAGAATAIGLMLYLRRIKS